MHSPHALPIVVMVLSRLLGAAFLTSKSVASTKQPQSEWAHHSISLQREGYGLRAAFEFYFQSYELRHLLFLGGNSSLLVPAQVMEEDGGLRGKAFFLTTA
jgi:hypothetical protein